ncbi:cupin domain-containing protein [Conexibacter sp. JD483]|uniref:cupin domain-containing protein n=1 Tax=unclassified Conexibacter TaxID=2627773 RepID=UPI00271C3775|nr:MULTISPECIES: cupin domain-containing protein [unclassified Conexibacter]MDO8186124.1 cupin domain-containing protein [Conexibacter sp. CPCC 205706]MDO8199614.1 cupin domain-containing protein [Conexibacter sp. CPCC 205762]MDR9369132.1 cupin domain-containing protein [Conexibacter sp. JD483]
MSDQIVSTDGYSVGSLDALGEGWGFRKIRSPLGVTAFGINAIVLPPGYDTNNHYHEHQEETYFVHSGRIAISFGDGTTHELGPGGLARVAPHTVRRLRNVGEGDAVYVCVGGKDGYVARDGVKVEDDGSETRR